MDSSFDESYLYYLPDEIIEHILSFLALEDKDTTCTAYPCYKYIISEEKRKFLDYNINLKKFEKLNVDLLMKSNNSYIKSIKKHKKFFIDLRFTEIIVELLGGYNIIMELPVMKFKCSYYGRGYFLDRIPIEDIKYRIMLGEDSNGRGFIVFKYTGGYMCLFSRDKKDKFRWMCCYGQGLHMEDFTYLAIGKQYINFSLLSKLSDFVHDPKIDVL